MNEFAGFHKTGRNSRVLSIDVYRVLFSVLVLLHHVYLLNTPNGETIMLGGDRSVEFFFILTGFLMARTVDGKGLVQKTDLGSDTVRYLFRKITRVYPYYLICFIQTFVMAQIAEHTQKRDLLWRMIFSWSELAFLRLGGWINQMYNGPTWYLSATFISILFIYPLLRLYGNLFQCVIAPLLCIIIYGYCANAFHTMKVIYQWNGLFYNGILRAVAGISCGCICYSAAKYLGQIHWKKDKRISDFFLILGGILFLCIVVMAQLTVKGMDSSFASNMDFTSLVFSALLVTLMFAREMIIPFEVCGGGAETKSVPVLREF